MSKRRLNEKVSLDDIPDDNKGGNCYQVAVDTLMKNPNAKLVHGVVTGQGAINGIQYGHAWVEDGDTVIDNTLRGDLRRLPKQLYYRIGNINITRKYTYNQALENLIKYEHYGPWDKVFDDYL